MDNTEECFLWAKHCFLRCERPIKSPFIPALLCWVERTSKLLNGEAVEMEEKQEPRRSPSCAYRPFLQRRPLSTSLCLSTVRPLCNASWDTQTPRGRGESPFHIKTHSQVTLSIQGAQEKAGYT